MAQALALRLLGTSLVTVREINGVHTRVVGSGTQPVVFLHGLFGQGKNFHEIAKSLGDIASSMLVDLPNHGRSAWTAEFDLDATADTLVAAVRTHAHDLGRTGVALIGHSLGGKIAMRFALRHPDLVTALVVADMSPVDGGVSQSFDTIIQALHDVDLSTLHRRQDAEHVLARRIDSPAVRAFLLQNLHHQDGAWHWRMNLDLLTSQIATVGSWPPVDATYDGPVLWIAGQRSDYIRPEFGPAMRALFPRTRLVTIKDAGHWVHSEQPQVFTQVVRHFLTEQADAGRLSPR